MTRTVASMVVAIITVLITLVTFEVTVAQNPSGGQYCSHAITQVPPTTSGGVNQFCNANCTDNGCGALFPKGYLLTYLDSGCYSEAENYFCFPNDSTVTLTLTKFVNECNPVQGVNNGCNCEFVSIGNLQKTVPDCSDSSD